MGYVNARDVVRLGRCSCPTSRARRRSGAVARPVAVPAGPVYLLHGTDDNVVPAIESTLLGRDLAARRPGARAADAAHHARRSGSRLDVAAIWRLIDFWSKMLDE